MVKLNQETIDMAYKMCVLIYETLFLDNVLPPANFMFMNGIFAVIELCSRNSADQIAVNVHFVGKRCHLKKMAEWLRFELKESDFEASTAPEHVVPSIVKVNVLPRPGNCHTWTNKNGPIQTRLLASKFETRPSIGGHFLLPFNGVMMNPLSGPDLLQNPVERMLTDEINPTELADNVSSAALKIQQLSVGPGRV